MSGRRSIRNRLRFNKVVKMIKISRFRINRLEILKIYRRKNVHFYRKRNLKVWIMGIKIHKLRNHQMKKSRKIENSRQNCRKVMWY